MSKTIAKKKGADLAFAWQLAFAFVLTAVVIMAPDFANATDNAMGYVFCTVTTWFTGNVGKGLATIAVTIIGIGALLGKVSWGMALIVGTGIAIVFGAATIVNTMGAEGASATCSTSS